MKTKLLVAALALPLAFSACTQDEFENAQNNGTQIPDNAIKGLVLNVQKSAEGDGADTRGIWQNDKINFEQNDKISLYWLGTVDGSSNSFGTAAVRTSLTGKFNSIFRTTDGESFTSEALVFEGGNIAVYPGDLSFTQEGEVLVSVPAAQDENTLKNVPYISNQLYIQKVDDQAEQIPGYYGEGGLVLDCPVKLAANVVNLTLNLSNIPQGYGFEVQSVELTASTSAFATDAKVTTTASVPQYKGEVVTKGETKANTIVAQTWIADNQKVATISTSNLTKVSDNTVIAHFVVLPTDETIASAEGTKIVVRTNCGTITMPSNTMLEGAAKYQLTKADGTKEAIDVALKSFVTSQTSSDEDSKFYNENIGKVANRSLAVDVAEATLNDSYVYTSDDIIRYVSLHTAMNSTENPVNLQMAVKGEKSDIFKGLTRTAVEQLNAKNTPTPIFTLTKATGAVTVTGLEIVGGGEVFDVPAIAASASLPLILSNETWSMKDAFAFKSNGLTGITNNGTLTIEGTEGEDAHNTIAEAITNNGTINLGGDGLVVVADAALKNTADAVINIAAEQELQFTKANNNGDLLGTINVNALTARLTATTADVNTNATINNYGTVAGSTTNGWINDTYTFGEDTYVGTIKMLGDNSIAYVKENENGVINLSKRNDEVVIDATEKGKIVYKWTNSTEDGKNFKQVATDRFNYVVFDGAVTPEVTLNEGDTDGTVDPDKTSVEIQGTCRLYAKNITIADLTVAKDATLQFTSGNTLNVTNLVNNGLITIGGKITYTGEFDGDNGRVLTTGDGAVTPQP